MGQAIIEKPNQRTAWKHWSGSLARIALKLGYALSNKSSVPKN